MKRLVLLSLLVGLSYSYINWTTEEEELRCLQCSKDTVTQALKQLDIKYSDVVLAQVMLESGNLSSKLTRLNNNLLGMRHPKKRETTSLGSNKGYAYYTDWYSCLEDYYLYQKAVLSKKNLTKHQYINYLAKTYAKDPQYKAKLITTIKRLHDKSI